MCQLSDLRSSHDTGLNSLDDGCIMVAVNPLNSLDSSEDQRGTPSPRSDGNATDDSGIDSISEKTEKCVHSDRPKKDMDRRASLFAFALGDPLPAFVARALPTAKTKATQQDIYGSLKRHTTDTTWRRDFVLNKGKESSKAGQVELTSIKSNVKKTVMDLENKLSQVPCPFI